MRLTSFTDYALRMLIYAAAAGRTVTIEEVARAYGLSKTHLNKVANTLTRAGYLIAIRGRSGGLALGCRPEETRIGDVVRLTEPDFALVECFTAGNRCVLTGRCKLTALFDRAATSFLDTLDQCTLADVALAPRDFLGVPPPLSAATCSLH